MLVDVSACHDVRTRYRHEIIIFYVPRLWCASAYNEDDLAGENRTYHFGADKIFLPIASVPITSVPTTSIHSVQILTLRPLYDVRSCPCGSKAITHYMHILYMRITVIDENDAI